MTKFDTLYKRTRTGAIQFWQVSVSADPAITKESGKLGTDKPLTHTEFINEGKQKRNPHEQAEFMALSDWTKKRDEGYKTLSDLGITLFPGEHNDLWLIANNPTGRKLATALEEVLPTYNTGSSGQMMPMKAPNKSWVANGKTKYPKQMEVKMDGLRSFIIMEPSSTEVLSKGGKSFPKMSHLVDILDAIFPKESRTQTFILDGELYKHGLSLQQMNQAIRGENEHTTTMQFWVYDLPTANKKQSRRSELVRNFIEYTAGHPDNPNPDVQFFHHNPPFMVHSDEEVLRRHDELVALGYEGGMLKDPEGLYQPGQRSSLWTKVKMFEDNEFTVVGYKLGQRGVQDLMFICRVNDKQTFEAVMNGTLAEKEELFARIDTLMGKQLTVKHFGYTEYGIPFLPKGKAFREEGE